MAVETHRVREAGLVGVLATDADRPPGPGVLVLGGSEGGLHEADAAAFAARGWTALALAYFGAEGLPRGLVGVRMEYLRRGLDVLAAASAPGPLAVVGGSRGGEAALLLSSYDDRVGAVVSVVGSGLVTPGIAYGLGSLDVMLAEAPPAWTVGDVPLPSVAHVVPPSVAADIATGDAPVRLADCYPPVPADPSAVTIPVERSRAAYLFVSAADDGMWPGAAYTQVAVDRLVAARHRHPVTHVVLPCGHPLPGPPGRPFRSTTSPGPGVTFELGGTARANTEGREQAWRATVDFLAAMHPP